MRRPWRTVLIAAGAVVVVGVIAVAVSTVRVASLAAGRAYPPDDVPERGVGLVLGARSHADRPSAFLAARLDVALSLFEAGKVRVLLVSGDNLARSNHETTMMRRYLEERGVPPERIFEDEAGFDTYDSCVRARDVFGVEELTIVTQDYHLDRAIAICRQVGVDAVGVPDESMRTRYPAVWAKGKGREWAANLKMEWDVATSRQPQADPFDPALLAAVEA